MRIYRPIREGKPARRWYIELKDHVGIVRRFAAYPANTKDDRRLSEDLGRQIELLVKYKSSGTMPKDETREWAATLSPKMKERLAKIGLLGKGAVESSRPLTEHIEAFRKKLKLGFKPKLKSGNSDNHVNTVSSRVERIVKECKFLFWANINLDVVHDFITRLKLSDKTYNYYCRDFMQFVNWMLKSGRADIAPAGELPTVEAEVKEDKRAFGLDEMERLIQATHAGPERQGLKGYDRAVLYLIAAETGFRLREMATLRVGSFDFADCAVSIEREHAKDRKTATIPLRTKTARRLREYFKGRDPDEPAFTMWKFPKGWKMIKADLEAAEIPYIDDDGLKGCFHSLRVTFITNLDGTDASLAERMTLARHSMRGNLTLGTYTKIRAYNLARVVEQLPDLSWPGESSEAQELRATGTDGKSGASNGAFLLESHSTHTHNSDQQPLIAAQKPRFQRARQDSNLQPSDSKSATLSN